MGLLVLVGVLGLLFGGMPHVSGDWHHLGWGPSGLGVILLRVLLVLFAGGRLSAMSHVLIVEDHRSYALLRDAWIKRALPSS